MRVHELIEHLRLISKLRAMGDKASFGADAALFDEAANTIERLNDKINLTPSPFCIDHSKIPYEECPWCLVDQIYRDGLPKEDGV